MRPGARARRDPRDRGACRARSRRPPARRSQPGVRARAGDQLGPGSFKTNATAFTNLFYDQSRTVRFGVEGTWRETEYIGLPGNSGYALMLMSEFRFQCADERKSCEALNGPAAP